MPNELPNPKRIKFKAGGAGAGLPVQRVESWRDIAMRMLVDEDDIANVRDLDDWTEQPPKAQHMS